MDAIRKKVALAYFGEDGHHASPIIDIIIKIIQMLLAGGICPTPKAALAWAKHRPRLTALRVAWTTGQVIDDPEQAAKVSDTITGLVPDATASDVDAVMSA